MNLILFHTFECLNGKHSDDTIDKEGNGKLRYDTIDNEGKHKNCAKKIINDEKEQSTVPAWLLGGLYNCLTVQICKWKKNFQ